MRLQEKIDELLRQTGRTQNDLAAKMGRHQSRISKWRNGVGHPLPEDLVAIADYFGVSVRYLIDDALDEDPGEVVPQPAPAAPVPRASVRPAPAPRNPAAAPAPPPPPPGDLTPEEALLLGLSRRLGVEKVIDHLLGIDGPAKPADHAADPAPAPPVTTAARIAPRGAAVARKPDPGREREREPEREPGREKK